MEKTINNVDFDKYIADYTEDFQSFGIETITKDEKRDGWYFAQVKVGDKTYYVEILIENNNAQIKNVLDSLDIITVKITKEKYTFKDKANITIEATASSQEATITELKLTKTGETNEVTGTKNGNKTTYEITAGDEYTYTVADSNSKNTSGTIKVEKLDAPTIEVNTTINSITVKVTNNYPSDANVKYKYQIGDNTASDKSETTYQQTGLEPDTEYTIVVTAYIVSEDNGKDSQIKGKTLASPVISASNITATSFKIDIINKSSSGVIYGYYIKENGASEWIEQTSDEVTGLESNKCYNVKAVATINGKNIDSNVINVGTEDIEVNFSNPTNLTGKQIDENKIEYIYNNGVINETFGGIEFENPENNSIAMMTSRYLFCATSTRCAWNNAQIRTKNTIDLSKYESLNAVINCTSYEEGNFGTRFLDSNNAYIKYKCVNSYEQKISTNTPYIISCDIDQTGEGYAGLHFTYDKFYVSQLYLVKK
jgi:predicted double-glycine peptidase